MAQKESNTHYTVSTAFDTRELQSNIRSFSELASTRSLGIDCRHAALDVRLRTTDEVFSVRGKREGRRHNLVDRRKNLQKQKGTLERLTRLTS